MPGSTDFNSAHVQNYADASTGEAATAQTLNLHYYNAIRNMLAHVSFDSAGLDAAIHTWGTGYAASNIISRWSALYGNQSPPPPQSCSTAHGDRMQPNECLLPGQTITSSNGCYYLVYQGDGNLVLYRSNGQPTWASRTDRTSAGRAVMQGDGNLVVYDGAGSARWASNTAGNAGSYLAVQDDGNAVIYRTNGSASWASNTVQPPCGPPPPTCAQTLADHCILRGNPSLSLRLILGGARFFLNWPSDCDMLGLNCNQSGFTEVSDGFLDSLPTVPRDGTLLKEHDDPAVYVMYGGMKSHIQSPDILLDCGYRWEDLGVVPNGALGSLPTTDPLGYPSCVPEAPTPPPAPHGAGDDFAGAFEIPSLPYAWAYDGTDSLTTEANEPLNPNGCIFGEGVMAHTSWYRFTAPTTGTALADTTGSDFDTVLAAYTGTDISSLALQACNDDANGFGLLSSIGFPVTAGGVYYLQLGGWEGASGVSQVNVSISTPPPPTGPVSFALGVDVNGDGTNDCGTGTPASVGDGAPDGVPVQVTNTVCNAPVDAQLRANVYLMDNGGVSYAGASAEVYFAGITSQGHGTTVWSCHVFDATYSGSGIENAGSAIGLDGTCGVPQANLGLMNRFTLTCSASGTIRLGNDLGETTLTDNSLTEHRDPGNDTLTINCVVPPTPTRTATPRTATPPSTVPSATRTATPQTPTATPPGLTPTRTPTSPTATQPRPATPTPTSGTSPTVQLTVPDTRLSAGELGVAHLNMEAASPGIGAFTFDVVYDPAVVHAVACDAPSFGVCGSAFGPNKVRVTGASANGIVGTVSLAEIDFEATGEPGSCSDLWIEVTVLAQPSGQALPFSASNGRICVERTGLTGDTDCDGAVTSLDALYILQYAAGIRGSLPCPGSADFNQDGRIDAVDAMLTLQDVAGLPSGLPL